ncbi:MAG: FKBP-type peptidyl-prolyl cis-trans isomerase [Candidatus Saccharimonadales bacterium]
MATSKAQRIGIIIMAVVMAVGTIGSFLIVIVANKNQEIDMRAQEERSKETQAALEKYQKEYEAYQEKQSEEAKKLSPKYYDLVKGYEKNASSFDASKVKELGKKDLKKGDGAEVKNANEVRAYYIGWNDKGKIFDSSIDGESLKAPIEVTHTIQGWQEGVVGMKMGGVRELTIPSEMAYGEQGSGEDIPANAPLKFIVVALPLGDLKEPEMPEALMQQMMSQQGY